MSDIETTDKNDSKIPTLERLMASWLGRNFGAFLRVLGAVILGAWIVGGARNPFVHSEELAGPGIATKALVGKLDSESRERDAAIMAMVNASDETRQQLVLEYRNSMAAVGSRLDMLTTTVRGLEASHRDLKLLIEAENGRRRARR